MTPPPDGQLRRWEIRVNLMEINKENLINLFRDCNVKYFDGELPEPDICVSHSRTRLGYFTCRFSRHGLSGIQALKVLSGQIHIPGKVRDQRIGITDYYLMTDDQVEDVMVHEMIHYSIAYTGLKDSAPHGVVFRGMMDAFNRKFGRHISVITQTKNWQPRAAQRPSSYLVLGLRMKDGTFFLSSVNPSYAADLERRVSSLRNVDAHWWVRTTDDYFRSFPRVRSLRGRLVSEAVFNSKMACPDKNK